MRQTGGYKLSKVSRARAGELLADGKFSVYRSGGRVYLLPLGFNNGSAYEIC